MTPGSGDSMAPGSGSRSSSLLTAELHLVFRSSLKLIHLHTQAATSSNRPTQPAASSRQIECPTGPLGPQARTRPGQRPGRKGIQKVLCFARIGLFSGFSNLAKHSDQPVSLENGRDPDRSYTVNFSELPDLVV